MLNNFSFQDRNIPKEKSFLYIFKILFQMQEVFIDEISEEDILSDEMIHSLCSQSKVEVTFLFRSYFSNTKILREIIIKLLSLLGAPILWQNRFMLIVDELNNNAIEYGSSEGDINKMHICITKENNVLDIHIEIEDSGKGKFAKTASDMEQIQEQKIQKGFEDHHSIRGRGLFLIIVKLVDRLYFQDGTQGGLIVGIQKQVLCT